MTKGNDKYEGMSSELVEAIGNAELRKLTAEADLAELKITNVQRELGSEDASMNWNRIHNFVGEVNFRSVQEAQLMLTHWALRDPGEPITVVFNSPGGSVIDGLALYDDIIGLRDQGAVINTVCRGYAASMGSILLQAGEERIIGKNSYVMIHEPSKMQMGKLFELEDDLEFMKRLNNRLANILAERSTLTPQKIKNKWNRRDVWLDAEQTVELGLADRIG